MTLLLKIRVSASASALHAHAKRSLVQRRSNLFKCYLNTQVRRPTRIRFRLCWWRNGIRCMSLQKICSKHWQNTNTTQRRKLSRTYIVKSQYRLRCWMQSLRWFLENMPAAYFRAIGQEERLQHLNAVTALVHAQQPEVMLRSSDHKVYSYIRTGGTTRISSRRYHPPTQFNS